MAIDRLRCHKWAILGIVTYALFLDYFIYGLIVPLGAYSPAKFTGESQISMLYGAYALGVLLSTPVFGYLGDRLGCRRPMLIGVALSATASVLFCFGAHFYWGLLARFAQGAAAAATWTAGLALVAENYPDKRVEMMGIAMLGSTAGSVVGPAAGGLLYDWGGYQLPFFITLGMVGIDACLRLFALPPDKRSADKSPALAALLSDPAILVAGLAVAVAAAGWGIVEPLLPSQVRLAGASPGQVGMMFTISTIAYGCAVPMVARAADRFSIKRTICFGIVAMASALPLLAVSSNILIVGLVLCVVSASFAFILNPSSAELGNAVDRRGLNCYAAAYAVYNITYSVGMMGANFLASIAADKLPFFQTLLIVSVILLLCIPLILKSVDTPRTIECA
jgi:MFS family permease